MKDHQKRERLLEDREQLQRTLRDFDAGKLDHLGQRDLDHFVENVKRRIAELSDQIACLDRKL